MKKLILLQVIILLSFFGFSQNLKKIESNYGLFKKKEKTKNVDVTWGDELKFGRNEWFREYVGDDKRNHYVVISTKKGYSLNMLNSNMTVVREVEINFLNKENKKMYYKGAYIFNHKLLIFASYYDKKNKKKTLYYRSYSLHNLNEEKLVILGEITFEKRMLKTSFGMSISEDKSKLVVYLSKLYNRKASEMYKFIVLSDNLEKLWEKDVKLPYLDRNFLVEDYKVNDEGDVYLLGKKYDDNNKSKNYIYHILSYSKKRNNVKDSEISLAGKFIKKITYKIAKNGDLIFSGVYSENGEYSTKGIFYMTRDFETKQIKNYSVRELEVNFVEKDWAGRVIRKEKTQEKKQGDASDMYEYNLTDFVLREDGSAVLIIEQYYLNILMSSYVDKTGFSKVYSINHYHYNDIIVVGFNPKGEVEWMSRIEKDQHSINDKGRESSYVLSVDKDELRILFTESAQMYYTNKELKDISKNGKRIRITRLETIDREGEVKGSILIDASSESTKMTPKKSRQVNENELFIYTYKDNIVKLGLVKFN